MMLCPVPGVRPIALSKSFPTPITKDSAEVVTRLAVGPPELALPLPVAPIAPEPFVPDTVTPLKLITVIEETTLCDKVAVTLALLSAVVERARQISDVPL